MDDDIAFETPMPLTSSSVVCVWESMVKSGGETTETDQKVKSQAN